MITVYIVGQPGSGKSTLMRELTKDCRREPSKGLFARDPVPHDILLNREPEIIGAELGKRRPDFSGTDALSMSIGPKAAEWASERPYRLLLGEGARLATRGFLRAAEGAGRLFLIHLDTPDPVAAARREARGSKQNGTWVRGAATRAANIARSGIGTLVSLPGAEPPEILAEMMFEAIPELEVLR